MVRDANPIRARGQAIATWKATSSNATGVQRHRGQFSNSSILFLQGSHVNPARHTRVSEEMLGCEN